MNMEFAIFNKETKDYTYDEEDLMVGAGLDIRMGFEDVAIQCDGTVIVCDKCGNFGYLDSSKYEFRMRLTYEGKCSPA